jgi:hypothetical protein
MKWTFDDYRLGLTTDGRIVNQTKAVRPSKMLKDVWYHEAGKICANMNRPKDTKDRFVSVDIEYHGHRGGIRVQLRLMERKGWTLQPLTSHSVICQCGIGEVIHEIAMFCDRCNAAPLIDADDDRGYQLSDSLQKILCKDGRPFPRPAPDLDIDNIFAAGMGPGRGRL